MAPDSIRGTDRVDLRLATVLAKRVGIEDKADPDRWRREGALRAQMPLGSTKERVLLPTGKGGQAEILPCSRSSVLGDLKADVLADSREHEVLVRKRSRCPYVIQEQGVRVGRSAAQRGC